MSGGVDSSVAAARAVDAGHDVVGIHLALSAQPGTLRTGARGCCTKEDAADARRWLLECHLQRRWEARDGDAEELMSVGVSYLERLSNDEW